MTRDGAQRLRIDLVALLAAAGVGAEETYVERREERRPASWLAMILLPDGEEIPSSVKDISTSGARLAVPERYELPPTFSFRVIGKEFVLQARLAWRRDGYAGVEILRIGRAPRPAPRPARTQPEPPPSPSRGLPDPRLRSRILSDRA